MRAAFSVGLCLAVGIGAPAAVAQARGEYRVVFASARQLARQLEDAGREGFSCVAIAHADSSAGVPAIAVVLGRATAGAAQPVSSQVIVGGRTASDLQPLLAAAGASGFRLCGVVLVEERPTSALVAVAIQRADPANATWQYGVEVLTNYKSSLSRLNAAARDGFLPVAAEATDSSRVVAMRTWMVVTERPASGRSPSEVAVRSSSGAEGLQRALNEQGRLGFHADLVWKEGNDVVAMMSRSLDPSPAPVSFVVNATDLSKIHFMAGRYLTDVPYLSSGDRLLVSEQSVDAENDVVEDPLPKLGALGYADSGAMGVLGDHITRNRGYAPVAAWIRQGSGGRLVLTTVITKR